MFCQRILLCSILLIIIFSSAVFAQATWYVPDDYSSIQEAINSSNHGQVIIVRPGTYMENINYLGKAITLVSETGPDVTVIDGGKTDSVVTLINNEGQDAVLEGFTITNGIGRYISSGHRSGGGIYCETSSPTITNCHIQFNDAEDGAGIYHSSGALNMTECTLRNNIAYWGGGIYILTGFPNIKDCQFIENYAFTFGGGMVNAGASHPTVSHCSFIGNGAESSGGGIFNCDNSGLALSNCIISNNSASRGGGICNSWSSPILTNCTLSDNLAYDKGGAFICYNSHAELTNCILWNDQPNEIWQDLQSTTNVQYCCIQRRHPGEDNINEDPLFADPANKDYRLTQYSPCINRGTNVDAPLVDFDYEARPFMGLVDMGVDEYTDAHTLAAAHFIISQSNGGSIPMILEAGSAHGGSWYCLFGSITGTAPGTPLPHGDSNLPVNYDGFTNQVLAMLNAPLYENFLGILNGSGSGAAALNVAPGRIPLGWVGHSLYFAYTLDTFAMVSNPIAIEITP